MRLRSKRHFEHAGMEAKRAKITGLADESSNHSVWSILIPRLDLDEQMALSVASSTLRRKISVYCEDQLKNLTNRLNNNPKQWARQINNPSESLKLPKAGWAFYRAMAKMRSGGSWNGKSAIALLCKVKKIAEGMTTHVTSGKRQRAGRLCPRSCKNTQVCSPDWCISYTHYCNHRCNHQYCEVLDLVDGKKWCMEPDYRKIPRKAGNTIRPRQTYRLYGFRTSGNFLLCHVWFTEQWHNRERLPDPYGLVIFDLAARKHHWVDTTLINPANLLGNSPAQVHEFSFLSWVSARKTCFQFDSVSNTLKLVLYFQYELSSTAVFELEVTVPDFKTSVISSVKIRSTRF